ncbi:MAG TPA: AAA family ATPase, partial [Terriglobales bacterium]|nr:AAA family ATPase [Terriglobales bacterium]
MLKLKKLQILGFKSFCDRTELKFHGDGIAAIVGPNGCGKSNISDAISWVLGEQSAKTLRGSRMEDVIFIGTRERKPTGMAEVSLTLIDPEVYEGGPALLSTETEIEIQDGGLDDWDEAALRDSAAADTEQAIAEVQPLSPEELEVEGTTETGVADAPGAGETEAGDAGKHVVLKIRRRKLRPASVKAGEIVITRRLFRSGESEYLLNGKICRLRDIQDLFMGTGLGPESYAIIEQGRIGQILSSKPHDRRAIIEEAAGVTKFKTKKRLSEARLEQSKLNLARINDIFDEVTRQMNSLKRQAAKAERYARLREELRAKLRVVLASRFAQMARDSESLKGDLARIAGEIESRTESVQQRESEQATNHQRGYALQEEARQNAERLTSIALEADRASGRRQHNEERCAELAARSAAAQAEMGRTGEQLAKIEGELATNRAILESAAADAAAASQESALRQHEAQTAVAALANAEQMQEQRRGEIMETVAAASAVRNELAKAEEHAAALKRESDRIGQEITAGRQQLENFGGQRGQAALEFESVSQAVAQLTQQVAGTRASLENKRAAESEAKLQLDGLRAEYASALGKKSSLEAMIAQHGYSTESVKRLFQSGAVQKGFAPAGVLADFLEVEDRYENVVEDFLRDELNYVVVKSWDAADEGLRLLRSNVDGRATFLVHPEDAQARFSFIFDEKSRPAPRRDSVVPLKNCIRVLNGFGKSLEVILPKLGNGYITQDANTARDMALENPNAFFLTPGGETFHNVTVTGGKKSSEGPLSMKRELRDALRSLAELEAALREQEARVGLLGREIAQLTSRLSRLEEEKREAESRALTSGHALQQLESELGRIQQRMTTYDAEFSRISEEAQQTAQTLAEKQHEHARHEAQHREIEAEFQTTQSQLAGLREARDAAGQSASLAASRSAALQERQTAAGSALQRIETLCTETQMRLASLEAQIEAAAAEQRQRQSENTTLAEQLSTLQTEQETGKQRAAELQASAEQLRAQGQLIEQQLRELRTELDRARGQRGEV